MINNMQEIFSAILQSANNTSRRLNILCAPTHESYETELCRTGHNFYAITHPQFKTWNAQYRDVPHNYTILKGQFLEEQLQQCPVIDCILSANKFGQWQILSQIAARFNCGFISLEHTQPVPNWPEHTRQQVKNMRGDINVFIARDSITKWGFQENDKTVRVIEHGIDTDAFSGWVGGDQKILTVVNDYKNRDWCCGWNLYQAITQGMPINPIGATPGFSQPALNEQHLIHCYRHASVFLNTSLISPIPHSLLEAMSVGCPVVTTATCEIPNIVIDGYNGFISNDVSVLRERVKQLLIDQTLATELSKNARQTIIDRFSLRRFVNDWNTTFYAAANGQPNTWRIF